jgi:hypothetical protein
MSIYVVGSSKNKFLPLNDIRNKFLIDEPHEGANIDFLNPWYCELTGLYYMWRHCTDDIVGLEHYRRYFVNDDGELLSNERVRHILMNYDIVMRRFEFPTNKPNIMSYFSNGRKPYLLNFIKLLDDDYREFITNAIENKHYFAQCNMFICTRNLLNAYCLWLFPQLAKIPFDVFIKSPRIVGYLAEFIFGWFMEFNHKTIYWAKTITLSKS